ncbi:hypothetical protein A6U85_08790 [Agrobacterium sp. 13-626]|nr:hypothetical protein CN09_24385 [Rhizobium rhizogenes]OCJ01748.1 hypothetical protein A6U85_08790 [Agrobacterium sp. 13-626]OCJ19460.1 hypothetical protein A6U89_15885 [Agrobacterium sp. B133/95]
MALCLSRLATGVTTVALSLAGSFFLDLAGDAVFLRRLACFDLGLGGGFSGSLAFYGLRLQALALLELCSLLLGVSLFPGGGNGLALCLLGKLGGVVAVFCSAKGVKKSSFRFLGRAAAIGKFVVSGVFQCSVLVVVF